MRLPLLKQKLSRADYLAWEAAQSNKNEFLAGEVFAMVGARQAHVLVAGALNSLFRDHLRGTRCRTYISDMKLEVDAADAIFYPDLMVSCDEADRQATLTLRSPCLIAEVLSDSTAAFDRGHKFSAYRQVPSLREYLLVDADARRLELFRLQEAGWVLHEPKQATGLLKLESIGLDLDMRRVFEDLDDAGVDSGAAPGG
jgi:Uma2 family endonuclease